MTSLTIHTPVPAAANAVLTMPANVNYGKKSNTGNNYISYSSAPKNWFQKPSARAFTFDWELNMNELEFE